jgi:hypothetical protein
MGGAHEQAAGPHKPSERGPAPADANDVGRGRYILSGAQRGPAGWVADDRHDNDDDKRAAQTSAGRRCRRRRRPLLLLPIHSAPKQAHRSRTGRGAALVTLSRPCVPMPECKPMFVASRRALI